MPGEASRENAWSLGVDACALIVGCVPVRSGCARSREYARNAAIEPPDHPPPQFDLTRCAATREKVNYAVNERVPGYMYIRVMYRYINVGGEVSPEVLPERETCLDRYVYRTDRDEVRIYGGSGRAEGESKGERRGGGGRGCTMENTYLLPRSRRINLFVGGTVRFLGRYYTRGRE